MCRERAELNEKARAAAKERFASISARSRLEVDHIKSGARSAREGLASARRMQADEIRSARKTEEKRKQALKDETLQRNRQVHDLLYANKFAPRERARKVNLPGRIGKTAFNAYDADAAAADAAAAETETAAAQASREAETREAEARAKAQRDAEQDAIRAKAAAESKVTGVSQVSAWLDKKGLGACKKGLADVSTLIELANLEPTELRAKLASVDAKERTKLMKAIDTLEL
mmetsp:Transcript_35660/g.93596  ORF Transcript_35660/g.93596 Transcript_35660/m.93596 type:complete len:232 (-) Transcript_35660:561-1256(-)